MATTESGMTKWTEAEKLALCISIIAASGSPDWKNVKLPAGRTKKACLHVYNSLKKQSEGIALGGSNTQVVGKPRKKAVTNGAAVKRKRGGKAPKAGEAVDEADDENEEGVKLKKSKTGVDKGIKEEVDEDNVDAKETSGDEDEEA
ncbi:MAG: hypothetical protein M1830_000279 [Pleopsidium flavum]|nr:MAG: hypothetical protein M1830_001165 [Pleopsidium flavum]KAI9878663.1 MAG: hypothetical protein M1830_000279 [Pleopsidium flavum]